MRRGKGVTLTAMPSKIVRIEYSGQRETFDLSVVGPYHNFVGNGMVVHNCFSEISARYAELPEEFYVPEEAQITNQSASNKQMRTDETNPHAFYIRKEIEEVCKRAFAAYKNMLADGCPRELARSVLPVGTYSHMFATVSLHNLMRFLQLRLHSHSQYEIRVYAEAMLKLIEPIVPVSVAAFKEHVLLSTK